MLSFNTEEGGKRERESTKEKHYGNPRASVLTYFVL